MLERRINPACAVVTGEMKPALRQVDASQRKYRSRRTLVPIEGPHRGIFCFGPRAARDGFRLRASPWAGMVARLWRLQLGGAGFGGLNQSQIARMDEAPFFVVVRTGKRSD